MIRPRDDGAPAAADGAEGRREPGHAARRTALPAAGAGAEAEAGPALPAAGASGWTLPLELAGDGRFPSRRPAPVADTARLILEIVPGERRLLPEFGCRVHFLPAIDAAADRELAAALIEEAIERWAPGLRVERAEVTSVEEGAIRVRLRAWNSWHAFAVAHRHAAAAARRRAPWLEEADGGGERAEGGTT